MNKIALVAMLFSFFSPALVQAHPASGAPKPFSVEICSADGAKRVDAVFFGVKAPMQSQLPTPRGEGVHKGHCPFCTSDNGVEITFF